MKILINISIFFLFFSGFAYAQQELRAVKNDQIKLNTTLTGEKVIWQQSSDKNQWEDIQTVETEQI